jgi:hypothetical protein
MALWKEPKFIMQSDLSGFDIFQIADELIEIEFEDGQPALHFTRGDLEYILKKMT